MKLKKTLRYLGIIFIGLLIIGFLYGFYFYVSSLSKGCKKGYYTASELQIYNTGYKDGADDMKEALSKTNVIR